MGMYNEVFDECPQCAKRAGYLQISQIVLGFGEFDLSDLAGLKSRLDSGSLSAEQLSELADAVEASDAVFRCGSDHSGPEGCGASWRADPAKSLAVRLLARVDEQDTRERAIELLVKAGVLKN